jgi:capsular polysaccharide biosynthesis protein
MELIRYLVVLRNRWKVLVAAVLVAMAAAWFLTPRQHLYRATSTLYVGSRKIDLNNPNDVQYGQLATLDRFIQTFAQMIRSAPVAARAVERAGVPRSADSVVAATTTHQVGQTSSGTGSGATQLLAIDVTDQDPVVARTLANAIADAFVEEVRNFEPTAPTNEGSIPALPAYVFEQARLPLTPQPTGLMTNLLVAALLGLLLGIGVVLLEDYLDITIRGLEDAERRLGLPVLGAVPDLGPVVDRSLRPRRPAQPRAIV